MMYQLQRVAFLVCAIIAVNACKQSPEKQPTHEKIIRDKIIENGSLYDSLLRTPLKEGYEPSHPINSFSHNVHVNDLKLDCRLCHNGPNADPEIRFKNVCSNCHDSNAPE